MKKKKAQELTPEQAQLKSQGWDEAIDMIVNELRKQTELLHKAARDTKRVDLHDSYKYGVQLYKALAEQLKSAKGNPRQQVFDSEEVRDLVDHLTGSVMSISNHTMAFFDKSVLPLYIAGQLELKRFTTPLKPDEQQDTVQGEEKH